MPPKGMAAKAAERPHLLRADQPSELLQPLRRLQTWCGEARVRPRRGLRIRVRVTARDAEYTARYTSPQALTLVYS